MTFCRLFSAVGFMLLLNAYSADAEVRRALVIGISEYPNYTDNPIKFADTDARRFKGFLESDQGGRTKVTLLTNGEASRDSIWDAVETLRAEPGQRR